MDLIVARLHIPFAVSFFILFALGLNRRGPKKIAQILYLTLNWSKGLFLKHFQNFRKTLSFLIGLDIR